ncbi:MAG: hypothetical protein QXY94_05310 [Archaeoglobaceae archaeon]
MAKMMNSKKQTNAKVLGCQGWQVAKERLLSLLERIRFSLRDHLSRSEIDRLERAHKGTISAIALASKRVDRSSLSIKTFFDLPCPRCREKSVTVTIKRGAITASKVSCGFCGFRVEAAKLNGVPFAKCPRCGYIATIAQGKREDGSVFFAFHCDRCSWVSDDRFTQVALSLLPH